MPAGRRSSRAAAKRAATALENTPKGFADLEDEPMPDADAGADADFEAEEEGNESDGDNKDDEEPEEQEEAEEGDDSEEQGQPAEEPSTLEEATERRQEQIRNGLIKEGEGPQTIIIKKRRPGRPPKNRPPEYDLIEVDVRDLDTPKRRGRGGWRGRGGRKGAMSAKAEQVIDAEGTVAEIVDDECVIPEDAEGETKVDKLGNLQDGRDYRCRTFTVLGRGNRQYMLSTEPARCVGFRDSYLFFTKHRKLHKIIVDDDEKRDMIEREIIPHSYKGRSIGIVTARSVFREFGARIIVGGKRIIDDYNVAAVKADGGVEGQLADPDDKIIPGEPYNKNQYVAWHGASAVYHTNVPSVPAPSGKPEYKRRRVNVNDTNWMLEHAREASTFNASINALRKLNNSGVYDIHTNTIQYPASMQPTRARYTQISPDAEQEAADSPNFPPVPIKVARNFLVTDTIFESPLRLQPVAAETSSDPTDFLASFNGLGALSADLKDLLPADCRKALEESLGREKEWHARWGAENDFAARRRPIIDKAIVPYSMGPSM